jgi:hypothetical protein
MGASKNAGSGIFLAWTGPVRNGIFPSFRDTPFFERTKLRTGQA